MKALLNHRNIYLAGLLIMVAGLSLSNILMSVGQFIMFFNWVAEGQIKSKISSFLKNRLALLVSSIYFLHLIGLVYTSDFQYALKDLRIKIPLLLLPLIISTSRPLNAKEFRLIIYVFLAAVFSSSFVTAKLVLIDKITDPKLASPFISHIRLSLMICLAIAYSIYYALEAGVKRYIFAGLVLWLAISLVLLEAFTGIMIFAALSSVILVYFAMRTPVIWHKLLLIIIAILLPLGSVITVYGIAKSYFHQPDIGSLPVYTAKGNLYKHEIDFFPVENGKYVGSHICEEELEEAWNKLSGISYDSLDRKGQKIQYTLIRYLTSKDLTKDYEGIMLLEKGDILNIENGIANVKYLTSFSPYKRMLEFFWEYENYRRTGDPSGHSLMQRLEYWKTAKQIIASKPLTGVGTGDVKQEFHHQYVEGNSPLKAKYRLRAHNQYLTMAVAFGIPGLLLFIIVLLYPGYIKKMYSEYFYLCFFIVAILSMLNEDTLETQAGASFFAFFFTLFIFAYPERDIKKEPV